MAVAPNGEPLMVDVADPNVVSLAPQPVRRLGDLSTYELMGMKTGDTTLEARLDNVGQTPMNDRVRHEMWMSMPVWAELLVSVMGFDFRQRAEPWGKLVYGSTNPAWKNVTLSNIEEAVASLADTTWWFWASSTTIRRFGFRIHRNSRANTSVAPS